MAPSTEDTFMTRLRTYDDLENWVSHYSRTGKLLIAGTYQYAVFRFVAVKRAYYLSTFCCNDTMINIFLHGVPCMDEAEVQKWLDFTIGSLTDQFCSDDDWALDRDNLTPSQQRLLDQFIDHSIETWLKNYFYIR